MFFLFNGLLYRQACVCQPPSQGQKRSRKAGVDLGQDEYEEPGSERHFDSQILCRSRKSSDLILYAPTWKGRFLTAALPSKIGSACDRLAASVAAVKTR